MALARAVLTTLYMNQKLLLVGLALGSAVAGCSNGTPGSSRYTQASDAGASDIGTVSNDAAMAHSDSASATVDAEVLDGSAGEDGACFPVWASNYDQSCSVDSDCVDVGQTGCPANTCAFCMTGTINKKAYERYALAFSHVTAGVSWDAGPSCNCVATGAPCCRAGACTLECYARSQGH